MPNGKYTAMVYNRSSPPRFEWMTLGGKRLVERRLDPEPAPPTPVAAALEHALGEPLQRVVLLAQPTPANCPNTLLAMTMVASGSLSERVQHSIGLLPPAKDRQIRVIVGAEHGEDWLKGLQIRLRPLGANEEKFTRLNSVEDDKRIVRDVKAFEDQEERLNGPYVLTLQEADPRGKSELHFGLMKFPNRRLDVVFYRNAAGRLTLSQFAPVSAESIDVPFRVAESRTFALLSRLQCDLAAGDARTTPHVLSALSTDRDPITVAIRAYMTLVRSSATDLKQTAEILQKIAPEMPDVLVLKGMIAETSPEAKRGAGKLPPAAAEAYRRALNQGLPVLMPFLEILWDAIQRDRAMALETRYGSILQQIMPKRLRFQLWSAWTS